MARQLTRRESNFPVTLKVTVSHNQRNALEALSQAGRLSISAATRLALDHGIPLVRESLQEREQPNNRERRSCDQ